MPLSSVGQLFADDMALASEGLPHGMDADWATRPRVNPWTGWAPSTDTISTIGWAAIYETREPDNPQPQARVLVRDVTLWIATDTGWKPYGTVTPHGAAPLESGGHNIPWDAVQQPDGSLSGRAGVYPDGSRRYFHPWSPRTPIDPSTVRNVAVTLRAKLDLPTVDVALPRPRFCVYPGVDWYSARGWQRDSFVSRGKLVTEEWRLFTGIARPECLPPPVSTTAAEQT